LVTVWTASSSMRS